MTRHGILGVEMEAAELYNLAARYGRRALAVLTVSDHLQTGEALPADQREQSFGDMVEIAWRPLLPNLNHRPWVPANCEHYIQDVAAKLQPPRLPTLQTRSRLGRGQSPDP